MLRIRAPRDFGAALIFFAVGLAGLALGADLPGMRSGGQLGPGSLPHALSWAVMAFGVLMLLRSLVTDGPPIEGVPLRALLAIIGAIVAFGTLIETAGYLPAAIVTPLIAGLAMAGSRREGLVVAVALGVGSTVLFVILLGQPLRIWGGP